MVEWIHLFNYVGGCLNENGFPDPATLDYLLTEWWEIDDEQNLWQAREIILEMCSARNKGLSYRPEKE